MVLARYLIGSAAKPGGENCVRRYTRLLSRKMLKGVKGMTSVQLGVMYLRDSQVNHVPGSYVGESHVSKVRQQEFSLPIHTKIAVASLWREGFVEVRGRSIRSGETLEPLVVDLTNPLQGRKSCNYSGFSSKLDIRLTISTYYLALCKIY